jgi:hypothetical protein
MKNHISEEWCDINSPTSVKEGILHNNELLVNILKIVKNIEENVKVNTNKIEELSKKIDLNLINIDKNINDIDIEIENEINSIHTDMNIIKQENQDTRKTLMENREIFTKVMNKFITLENEEIKPILNQINNNQTKMTNNSILLPSFEKTVEQNRLWRLYSNNFRQNTSINNNNIITQLSLSHYEKK